MDSIVNEVSKGRDNYKFLGQIRNASEHEPITPQEHLALQAVGTAIDVMSTTGKFYDIVNEFTYSADIPMAKLNKHKTLRNMIVDIAINYDDVTTKKMAYRKMKAVIYNRTNFFGKSTLESIHSNYSADEPDHNITYLDRIECSVCSTKHVEDNMWDGVCDACFVEGF